MNMPVGNNKFDANFVDGELVFSGRLDASQVDRARETLLAHPTCAIINLAPLEFICSGGIGLFFGHCQRVQPHGLRLQVNGARPHIRRILELARLDSCADIG